jgi:hypothetical protein
MYSHSYDFTREEDTFEHRVRLRPPPRNFFNLSATAPSSEACAVVHGEAETAFVLAPFRIGNLFRMQRSLSLAEYHLVLH